MIPGYDIDLQETITKIKAARHKNVGLQFPAGLLKHATTIASTLEMEADTAVTILAEPTYGACDVYRHGEDLGLDAIVHIGHTPMPTLVQPQPTYFISAQSTHDIETCLKASLPLLADPIGLVTNTQHLHRLEEALDFLKKNDHHAHTDKGSLRITSNAQVIGCNYTAATTMDDRVASYLFLGSGDFHPLGLALSTDRPVIAANPYDGSARAMTGIKDRFLRQRHGAISSAAKAESFGLLLSPKPGQKRSGIAQRARRQLTDAGKSSFLIASEEMRADQLQYYPVDVFVNTACCRIATDDLESFDRPILTPVELEIALGIRTWDTWQFDQMF